MKKPKKLKLGELLVARGVVPSLQAAEALVLAGQVLVDSQPAGKLGDLVDVNADISVRQQRQYVGRGALKLEGAFEQYPINLQGLVCADVGSSTGGFTQVLLRRGAERVYAIDVGYGELAWELRQDARVVVMERTNARYLESLPEPIDVATVDVSFISLKKILPQIQKWLRTPLASNAPQIIALIKPQFEARPDLVEEGGLVRDPAVHRLVLADILGWCQESGLYLTHLGCSPIRGGDGNVEFLAILGPHRPRPGGLEEMISAVLSEGSP